MKELSQRAIWVLLNLKTSRPNKLALFSEYQSRGFFVERQWKGEPMRSRLLFRFWPGDRLIESKSYEEDVAPLLDERTGGKK